MARPVLFRQWNAKLRILDATERFEVQCKRLNRNTDRELTPSLPSGQEE
jgi:hypothetical protein